MDKPWPTPKLLTEAEVEEIRTNARIGLRGPVMVLAVEKLLADHDARVELERTRQAGKPDAA